MKIVEVKKLVKLYVTPSLLRSWADMMEKKWPNLHCGDSITWNEFIVDDEIDIAILYDQDRMHKEYKKCQH
jgi:hypothetical protein